MLVRIVKLCIHPKESTTFLSNFEQQKESIRNFEGCRFLELYQDTTYKNIFFTYSYWDNEAALNNYRKSELFKGIWAKTKLMFVSKPEAWSVNKLQTLP